ncbi:MAG: hypothetical protein ACRDIE_06670, partial [Chloroflexota bacterium]
LHAGNDPVVVSGIMDPFEQVAMDASHYPVMGFATNTHRPWMLVEMKLLNFNDDRLLSELPRVAAVEHCCSTK